jgi:hypothetical protein
MHKLVAIVAVVVLALPACSSGGSSAPGGQPASRSAAPGDALSLRGVCPDPVVIQSDWWPQAEEGGLFELMGGHPAVDAAHKRVTAPLVTRGVDTGVRIEFRAGGPANSYTPAARELYLDRDVLLGTVDVDQNAMLRSGAQPVRAVFTPLDESPLVLMWDPATHPGFHTVSDIGQTDTRVLYFPGSSYMDYLVGSGKLRRSQVEASYDGTPARFVAERGKIVQQGYLTNEVYQYENELPQWKKKVAWTLVNDAGYPNYPEALSIRADRQAQLAPCLRRLVPILQRGDVDYARDAGRADALIVALVKDFGAFPYSERRARYALKAMLDNHLLGNGRNRTIGDFDTARVDAIIDAVRPIAAKARNPLRPGLSARDLVTNEYLDPSVGLR